MARKNEFRKFVCQRNYQYETHDADGNQTSDITEQDWREQVRKEWLSLFDDGLKKILFIFHDADVNPDGTSKGLHSHCVSEFENARSEQAACKKLHGSSLQNCQHCKSFVDAVRYLAHISEKALNEMKTLYDPHLIEGYYLDKNKEVVKMTFREIQEHMTRSHDLQQKGTALAVSDDCLIEVATNKATLSDISNRYIQDTYDVGLNFRAFLKDEPLFKRAYEQCQLAKSEFFRTHQRSLTTVYIEGEGGSGKTRLAGAFARSVADINGIHDVAAPGQSTTFDFASTYTGQNVSVFDELANAFPLEQFLSIFDPLKCSPVNSRHNDKLYFANYVLFTTSQFLERFIYDMWQPYANKHAKLSRLMRSKLGLSDSEQDWHDAYIRSNPETGNKILQIRRRIAIYVTVYNKTATVYYRDDASNVPFSYAFTPPGLFNPPYIEFRSLPYDVMHPDYQSQCDTVVQTMHECIEVYCKHNGFMLPEQFPKPFMDEDR